MDFSFSQQNSPSRNTRGYFYILNLASTFEKSAPVKLSQ